MLYLQNTTPRRYEGCILHERLFSSRVYIYSAGNKYIFGFVSIATRIIKYKYCNIIRIGLVKNRDCLIDNLC
jgi:hypothetical protein